MYAIRFNIVDQTRRRLLSGPFLTRAEAREVADRLVRAVGGDGYVVLDRDAVCDLATVEDCDGHGPAEEMFRLMTRAGGIAAADSPTGRTKTTASPSVHNVPPPPAADPRLRELFKEMAANVRGATVPTADELADEVHKEEVDAEMWAELAAEEEFGAGRGPGAADEDEDEDRVKLPERESFYGSVLDPN